MSETKTVTLSDGSVWTYNRLTQDWTGKRQVPGCNIPRGKWLRPCLADDSPLTAFDHRAIADVLDGEASALTPPAPNRTAWSIIRTAVSEARGVDGTYEECSAKLDDIARRVDDQLSALSAVARSDTET